MSKTYILHNNNAENLITSCKKNNKCLINNQVTYPFFLVRMNLLIFQNPYEFFQFFSTFLKIFCTVLKNKRNVTGD